MTRRDPYSWTVVRLPERNLAELVLELAAPLLERLIGSAAPKGPSSCALARSLGAVVLVLGSALCLGSCSSGCNDRKNASEATGASTVNSKPTATAHSRAMLVSVGGLGSCATDSAGGLWCWGDKEAQGNGGESGRRHRVPRPMQVPAPLRALDVGSVQACAIGADRRAWCWASIQQERRRGQTAAQQRVPEPVAGLDVELSAVAVGDSGAACAIDDSGELWCWDGDGAALGIGNGNQGPARTLGIVGRVDRVSVGQDFVLALTNEGALWTAGELRGAPGTSFPKDPGGGFSRVEGEFSNIHTDGFGAFVIRRTGEVLRWSKGRFEPIVAAPVGVREITGEAGVTCVLQDAGLVSCWGLGYYGALANGSLENQPRAAKATALPPLATLAVGSEHGCGITQDQRLLCWGNDAQGQVGVNQRGILAPVEVVLDGANALARPASPGRYLKVPDPTEPVATFEDLLDVRALPCQPSKEVVAGAGELWSVKGTLQNDPVTGELLRVGDDVFVRFLGARGGGLGPFAGRVDAEGRLELHERVTRTADSAPPHVLQGTLSDAFVLQAQLKQARLNARVQLLSLAATGKIGEDGQFTRYNALRAATQAERPTPDNPVAYADHTWLETTIDRREPGAPRIRVTGWTGGTTRGWCTPGAPLTAASDFIGKSVREWDVAVRKLLEPQPVVAVHFQSNECDRAWSIEQASIFTQDPKFGLVESRFEIRDTGITFVTRQCH